MLAGCGATETVSPTAETVVGTVAAREAAGASETRRPAPRSSPPRAAAAATPSSRPARTGNVGPDLDKLAQYAKAANQGSLQDFTHESIANPSAYIEKGYPNAMPNFGQTLSDKQIADLVAYLTQNQG